MSEKQDQSATTPPVPPNGLPFFVAHTPSRKNPQWHSLVDHTLSVASLAEQFAQPFGGASLARYCGRLHDLGKFDDNFQQYLYGCWRYDRKEIRAKPQPGSAPHKQSGAQIARKAVPQLGVHLAQILFGHHTRIESVHDTINKEAEWARKMRRSPEELLVRANGTQDNLIPPPPPMTELIPSFILSGGDKGDFEMYLRFVYSCLTDADGLDTEAHKSPVTAERRRIEAEKAPTMAQLLAAFQANQAELEHRVAEKGDANATVNTVRAAVLSDCLKAAETEPGAFTLTVPTGGGKTRSGLVFALKHAERWEKRRVIYAAPFTSILDQTAAVYEEIFDALATETDSRIVLEHHSAVEPGEATDGLDDREVWRRLAAENWDAPLVVTTQVQLFESLYSNRPGKCRKLHRIANSVLILDEVQTLPPSLLAPLVEGLKRLVAHYGVTLVLCTATQPALHAETPHFSGFNPRPTEIVSDVKAHFDALRRVRYQVAGEPWEIADAADRLREAESALCVVNTRRQATEILDALDPDRTDESAFHLSTMLCGHHRKAVLSEIRRRLREGLPTRLVSTTVVEAGVDVDFPRLFRALAPLPSLIQAAGRCNREGKRLADDSPVTIFIPADDKTPPDKLYQAARNKTRQWMAEAAQRGGTFDFDNPERVTEWFHAITADNGSLNDARQVEQSVRAFNYPEVAQKVKLIEDNTVPVLPLAYAEKHLDVNALFTAADRRGGLNRDDWRKLQPFCVSVYAKDAEKWEERFPGLFLWPGEYDEKTGLPLPNDPADGVVYEVERLMS